MEYVSAFLEGLYLVFQWPAIGYLFLCVFLGIWIGAVPGVGGFTGLILLLPFTYKMEPVPASALLLVMFAITSTNDTIAWSPIEESINGLAVFDGFTLLKPMDFDIIRTPLEVEIVDGRLQKDSIKRFGAKINFATLEIAEHTVENYIKSPDPKMVKWFQDFIKKRER